MSATSVAPRIDAPAREVVVAVPAPARVLDALVSVLPFWQFGELTPGQAPLLSLQQIASIPNVEWFSTLSSGARAALSRTQVQAIQPAALALDLLTDLQVTWLTAGQIRGLDFWEFPRLSPAQATYLTPAQVSTINNTDSIASWTPAARTALNPIQIQALNVSQVSIRLLAPAQIAALTPAQVQSAPFYDFAYLNPAQIPLLTTAQVASIPNTAALAAIPAPSIASLTASQIQALAPSVLSLGLLTDAQVASLTTSQIRALSFWDFPRLLGAQTPYLTNAQIASVNNTESFAAWSPQARAALTASQVQALDVRNISIRLLTGPQIAMLTAEEIRQIPFYDLPHLQPAQIPIVTTPQIAAIPNAEALANWYPPALAALTKAQIQSLTMTAIPLELLTEEQISWLTMAQAWGLPFYSWTYLAPNQIQSLPPVTFSTVTTADFFAELSDQQLAAMTRPQLLNLPSHVYATYMHSSGAVAPPDNYHPVAHMPIGENGLNANAHTNVEWSRVMALVPLQTATHVSVASGNWSDPNVWLNRSVPAGNARVVIAGNTTVQFDTWMHDYAIDTLRVDGTLSFVTNRGTQLKVDTIVVSEQGALHIGTEAAPIRSDAVARVVIADNGPINTVEDPYLLGRGLLSRGEVRMHGETVTPFVNLTANVSAGQAMLKVDVVPVNWRVGDTLVIAGTDPYLGHFRTDRVHVVAMSGKTIFTDPLQFGHFVPPGSGLSIQVANLDRNVTFVAEDSSVIGERPHIAFMHSPNVVIDNIAVEGFGRTDKRYNLNDVVVQNGILQPGTGLNQRARYSMHFHHAGVNPDVAPAIVRGSVVAGSPGWGYVNHQGNVVMENNVAYDVVGAAFATEDGNEIGVMRGNLALSSTGSLTRGDRRYNHDFGFAGHGFWFQGPGVEVIDNIAAGSQDAAFIYVTASSKSQFDAVNLLDRAMAGGRDIVPVGSVPLKAFRGNTAYASGTGLAIWNHMLLMPDGLSVIDQFTSWNSRDVGISLNYSGHIAIRDAVLLGNLNDYVGTGIESNRWTHDVTISNLHATGFEFGVIAPSRRGTLIDGGIIAAIQGIYIGKGHDTMRSVTVRGVSFPNLTSEQLKGRSHYDFVGTAIGLGNFADRPIESYFSSDAIYITSEMGSTAKFYFYEQAAVSVPFPEGTYKGFVPDKYLNKTNHQLLSEFGLSFGDAFPTATVAQTSEVYGWMQYRSRA